MPIRASTQFVEANSVQLPINFVTEPEYPIVPVSTELSQSVEPAPDRPVVVAIDSAANSADTSAITSMFVINDNYYNSENGLLVPVTATTNSTVISTSVTGFYHSQLSTWRVSTTSTTSTCLTPGGIYVNGTSFYINGPARRPMSEEDIARYRRRQAIKTHEDRKKAKGSIKRALKLMCNIGFEEEARIFLRGDTIEVSHPDSLLKFVISKRPNSLIQRTLSPGYSTPYELSVYTKSDVYVAKLCVYMDKTPILDQVMALAMFIKSGSEEEILKAANWFSKSNDPELFEIITLEYPYLKSKLR